MLSVHPSDYVASVYCCAGNQVQQPWISLVLENLGGGDESNLARGGGLKFSGGIFFSVCVLGGGGGVRPWKTMVC